MCCGFSLIGFALTIAGRSPSAMAKLTSFPRVKFAQMMSEMSAYMLIFFLAPQRPIVLPAIAIGHLMAPHGILRVTGFFDVVSRSQIDDAFILLRIGAAETGRE
jgi:hypothetical protein